MNYQLGREFLHQLARVRKRFSEVGIVYALQLLKWRLVSSRQIDANVWVVVSRDIRELAAVKDHDAAIRWATASDFAELISCGIKPAKLDVDFGRTLKIAVYEHEGRIIAFAQYAVRSWDQDDWLTFKFKPRDIYGAGVWVAQEHRGQNIASRVMAFAWSNYAQNGYERMVAITNALNRNSFRAAAKVGPGNFNRIWYLRLFGFTYLHYGSVRQIGRWNPRRRLEVLLGHTASK